MNYGHILSYQTHGLNLIGGYDRNPEVAEKQCRRTTKKSGQAARNIQRARFANLNSSNIVCNADMRIVEIRQFCQLQDEGGVLSLSNHQSLMRSAMSQLNLSARAYAQHHVIASLNFHAPLQI
jgi:predicted ATPase with chaperone activity